MAKLQNELSSGGVCGKNCYWISAALMAGACMGTGAFIFASNFSDYGIIGTGILAPGPFIMCLATRTYKEISYKRRTGSWFKPGNASRVMTPEGKILWKSLIPVTVNLLTNGGYLVVMSLG